MVVMVRGHGESGDVVVMMCGHGKGWGGGRRGRCDMAVVRVGTWS